MSLKPLPNHLRYPRFNEDTYNQYKIPYNKFDTMDDINMLRPILILRKKLLEND